MKKLKLLLSCFLIAMLCVVSTGCSKDGDGDKATIILVLEDKSEITYDVNVSEETSLREVLWQNELIDEETYGAYFVETIDGHTADVENDGVTWLPEDTDRNQITGTFDDVMINPGDTIYLEYYVVPYMD